MAAATHRHQRVAVGLPVHVLLRLASPHTATATIAAAGELAVGSKMIGLPSSMSTRVCGAYNSGTARAFASIC